MVSVEAFRTMALTFEGAEELPHFEKTSFRINKKIFATLDIENKRACLLLSPVDQSAFSAYDSNIIYAVPNKWGMKGATYMELDKVKKEVCIDALTVAYCKVAPKKLGEKYVQ